MYSEIDFRKKEQAWYDRQDCTHLYYSHPWLSSLEQTFNFQPILLIDKNEQFRTVFCQVDDVLGSRIIILPFSDYTPTCGMKREDYVKILDYLKENYPQSTIILKTTLSMDGELEAEKTNEIIHYKMSLSGQEPEPVSDSFCEKIEEAKANGYTTHISKDWAALSRFYELYHKLHFEVYKSIPQPFTFFKQLYYQYITNGNGFILEVSDQNEVHSSLIALSHKKTLYYKYGSFDQHDFSHPRTYLLFNKLIEQANELGFETLDLGLCPQHDGEEDSRALFEHIVADAIPVTYWTYAPEGKDAEMEQRVMQNLDKLTQSMIQSNLNPEQTSRFSEKVYTLYA
jgi:hypothetical protein